MSQLKDIAGQRFGILTPLKYLGSSSKGSLWLARCDCGEEIEVSRHKLMKGKKSCGCLVSPTKWENLLKKVRTANLSNKKYVYLARYNDHLIKIGHTSDPVHRISSLNQEFEGKFNLLKYVKTNRPCDLEKALHLIFNEDRVIIKRKDGSDCKEFFNIYSHEVDPYFLDVGAIIYYD
jgi:hypothetical protein